MLFEVAVIEKPTKKETEDGATEKLVFGPKAVIARDGQAAAIKALMGEGSAINWEKAEVLVRPFA